MATGWGIDAVTNGGEVSGTSAQDVRRIWGALYSPGVITGCGVHASPTAMTYTVDQGVAAIGLSGSGNSRQCVMVPVPSTVLTAAPNTSSSTRLDTIYVRQQIPGTTNDVVVELAQGTAVPANSQILAQHTASAGATTTSRSYFTGSVPYSVPYGANLGLFYTATDRSNATIPKGKRVTAAAGSFTLMTDRKCIFAADLCISALRPNGAEAMYFDNTAYVELIVEVLINGVREFSFNTPGLARAWGTYHFEEYVNLRSGTHSVAFRYYYGTPQGPGLVAKHYQGENASTGCTFTVRDGGFWESGPKGDNV